MKNLEFIWLELTSLCNLNCIHCYAGSGSKPDITNTLNKDDYINLINSAADLGCRKVQFIGGEPTLVPYLLDLIYHARTKDFEFIEVFTNATRISDSLLKTFVKNKVAIATSFYSRNPQIHDSITKKKRSHDLTVATIRRIIAAGLELRVGIIEMEANRNGLEETKEYLRELGVQTIGTDRLRGIGRGISMQDTEKEPKISELCGNCWRGSIAVGPDGIVAPCIMSRNWFIGSVRNTSLEALVHSEKLDLIRRKIYEVFWPPQPNLTETQSNPSCSPNCSPHCQPTCPPNCSPTCNPISCSPRECWPSTS